MTKTTVDTKIDLAEFNFYFWLGEEAESLTREGFIKKVEQERRYNLAWLNATEVSDDPIS